MISHEVGQILLIVLCCLIVIGFVVWLFADLNSSKKLLSKRVHFGENEVKEFESEGVDEEDE
jgi:hypothetical protein